MIITIDGPAGSGKSTVARRLAERLGIEFLDTGAGYRAVALSLLRQNLDEQVGEQRLAQVLADLRFEIRGGAFYVAGIDESRPLRQPEVTALAGRIADRKLVRDYLTSWQRRYAQGRSLVTEGRDQGTLVFPDALCKFYLEADADVRVDRRHRDLLSRGIEQTRAEVAAAQAERDRRDAERALAPLRPAADAIIIDSTQRSADDVVEQMEQLVRQRLASTKDRA
jgi:cytidylate kinase